LEKWEPEVPATEIGVGVAESVVALTGFVNTYAEKLAADHSLGDRKTSSHCKREVRRPASVGIGVAAKSRER
jgi:hypothetical protein